MILFPIQKEGRNVQRLLINFIDEAGETLRGYAWGNHAEHFFKMLKVSHLQDKQFVIFLYLISFIWLDRLHLHSVERKCKWCQVFTEFSTYLLHHLDDLDPKQEGFAAQNDCKEKNL